MDRATRESNLTALKRFHKQLGELAFSAGYQGLAGAQSILSSAAEEMQTEVENAEYDLEPVAAPMGHWSRGGM